MLSNHPLPQNDEGAFDPLSIRYLSLLQPGERLDSIGWEAGQRRTSPLAVGDEVVVDEHGQPFALFNCPVRLRIDERDSLGQLLRFTATAPETFGFFGQHVEAGSALTGWFFVLDEIQGVIRSS